MGSTLAQLRATLRLELRDQDEDALVWSDAALDRHLTRAIGEVTRLAPSLASTLKTVPSPAPSRLSMVADIDAATFLWLEGLEYPPDAHPPQWLPFREESPRVALLLSDDLPAAGDDVRVWYARGYTVTATAGDLPAELDAIVLDGAASFALTDRALELAPQLVARDAPTLYRILARDRAARYAEGLAHLRAGARPTLWTVSWR